MADYNVNMKQWNGTSFDNVLPLAYNSNKLGGQSLDQIKQWVDDNGLLLYTGQYTGTGTYGESNPTTFTFPFAPSLFFIPNASRDQYNPYLGLEVIPSLYLSTSYINMDTVLGWTIHVKKSADGKTFYMYGTAAAGEYGQANASGITYAFAAIGGNDIGGQTEWTITSSGTWTVPRTGRYMLELYGGGGGGFSYRASFGSAFASGGSSCQHYDSINLTVGTSVSVTIGTGGYRMPYGSIVSDTVATGTSFGNYSVAGGGNSVGVDSLTTGGAAAGNYGKAGTANMTSSTVDNNYPNGVLGSKYGYGSSNTQNYGGSGAVYLKYLGA